MTPEQVLSHFGVTRQTELARVLGKPVSTVADWFQRGAVPRAVQYELQIRTGGKLKAETSQ